MKFKRAPTLAYLCLLPLLLSLGVWQLNRAEEKRAMLRLQQQQQSADVLSLTATSADSLDVLLYKPVKALGHYDNSHQILLDNQVHQHKAGYLVLTPFILPQGNKAVLANRGWVAVGQSRSILPDVSVTQDAITVNGQINRFPRVALQLPESKTTANNWPIVVQTIDIATLSQQLGYPLFNFQIELAKTEPNGFIREWRQTVVMTPEKHTGYAVQWFLLALTLTVLYIKYGIDKNNNA